MALNTTETTETGNTSAYDRADEVLKRAQLPTVTLELLCGKCPPEKKPDFETALILLQRVSDAVNAAQSAECQVGVLPPTHGARKGG